MKKVRKFLYAVTLVITAAILISILHHYQLKARVDHYRAMLKANGNLPDLADALPPPVPPEQNSATKLLQAYAWLQSHENILSTNPMSGKRMVAPGKAMIVAAQPEYREPNPYGYTNSWADLEAAIGQNSGCLKALHQLILKPHLDFQIPYAKGWLESVFFTNEYVIELKKSATFATRAAVVEVHEGDIGAAVTNTRAALAIVDAMENERLTISELVRIAICHSALDATWEIMQKNGVSDTNLAALQNDWNRLNFTRGYKNALTMENVMGERMLAQWLESDVDLNKYFKIFDSAAEVMGDDVTERSGFLETIKTKANVFRWRYWWSYTDELRSLHGGEVLTETARCAETNGALAPLVQQQHKGLQALKLDDQVNRLDHPMLLLARPDLHTMLSDSVITLGNCFQRVIAAEAMKRLAVTAIALKRFELKHGDYPETLSELVPEFMPAVPLDPGDGQTLRYRRRDGGSFLLYSVGINGRDDDGDPSVDKEATSSSYNWLNTHSLDWVWPQPASAAEIEAYFAAENAKKD